MLWSTVSKPVAGSLVEAPSAEAADALHKEATGLGANEITEVKEGS